MKQVGGFKYFIVNEIRVAYIFLFRIVEFFINVLYLQLLSMSPRSLRCEYCDYERTVGSALAYP